MTSVERVLCALSLGEPDKVPFCEGLVGPGIYERITGEKIELNVDVAPDGTFNQSGEEIAEAQKKLSRAFGKDNINYNALAPCFVAETKIVDGRKVVGDGLIKTRDDLKYFKLPDPYDDDYYDVAKEFIAHKEDFAAVATMRLGIGSTLISMGLEGFSCALADDPGLVEEVLGIYVNWTKVAVERLIEIGFDVVWTFDDVAYNDGPMFSPTFYREFVLPKIKVAAESITVPWISHSDGDMNPILDDWLQLGMNAIHPIQPDVMDIFQLKKDYGDRICLIGNIDMSKLTFGTPEEVDAEVKEKIESLSPGGGYIISSSNSISDYLDTENVRAMLNAIRKYR